MYAHVDMSVSPWHKHDLPCPLDDSGWGDHVGTLDPLLALHTCEVKGQVTQLVSYLIFLLGR